MQVLGSKYGLSVFKKNTGLIKVFDPITETPYFRESKNDFFGAKIKYTEGLKNINIKKWLKTFYIEKVREDLIK